MPYVPKFKTLPMLLPGSVSPVTADELKNRWSELGIITQPRWESLTKNIYLKRYNIEEIEETQQKKVLLIYSEGYLDSFFFSTSAMLFQIYLFYESFSLLKLFPSWCSIYITCYSVLGKGLCLHANGMTQCSAPPRQDQPPCLLLSL